MKTIVLVLGLLLMESIAGAASRSHIDARAVTLFDRSIARYRQLRSFAIVAREEVSGGAKPRRTRLETSLQLPYRARLKMDTTDARGKLTTPITRRLIGAKSYLIWDLVSGNLAANTSRFIAIPADMDRSQAVGDMFYPSPSLALSLVSLATRINPAKMKNVARVTLRKARRDGKTLDQITVVRRDPGDPQPIVLEYFLSPRTHELAEFVIRRRAGGRDFVATTRFEPLKFNWKGSQSATDRLVYDWKAIAIPGLQAPAPTPKPILKVDDKARQIFARATKLYGALNSLSMTWSEKGTGPLVTARSSRNVQIAWERRGRLRLEDSEGFEQLIVIDGKTRSSLDTSNAGFGTKAKYKIEPFEGDAQQEVNTELVLAEGRASIFADWLYGANPLSVEKVEVRAGMGGLLELSAVALPPQTLDGQACDLVRLTTRYDDAYTTVPGQTVKHETFWFAQSDGRLMRVQTRSQEGRQKPADGDLQVTRQEFNPTFDDATFTFTPPEGAMRDKD